MKSLSEFINERYNAELEDNKEDFSFFVEADNDDEGDSEEDSQAADATEKSDEKVTLKLSFDGIDGGADAVKSIKSICSSNGLSFDDANLKNGIKITVTSDKKDGLEKVAELVQEFISSIPNEKHDDIDKELSTLSDQLDKLNDVLDGFSDEEE